MGKSISKKIAFIVSAILSITLGVMVIVLLTREQNQKKESTKEEVRNISQLITKSIVFAMSQGTTDISPYIEKTKDLNNLKELRVIPTNSIKENSENLMDEKEKEVLKQKSENSFSEDFGNSEVFRTITPMLADETCTSCHSVQNGEPLATVSVRYSMETMNAEIASQRRIAILLALGSVIVTFIFAIFFINKKIVNDLKKSIYCIEQLSSGAVDYTVINNRQDEIGHLNESLIKLKQSMSEKVKIGSEIANGNLDVNINLLSEKDLLGKAFINIIEILKNLVSDTKNLVEDAINGNLKKRIEVNKHNGEYREIVKGINETLDAVINPVMEGSKVLEVIASGDLTARVKGKYKGDHQIIKESINVVAAKLSKILSRVKQSVEETAVASNDISSSTEQMASGAQEQSEQTNEVAVSVEEMTKTIFENSKNASHASDVAKKAGEIAQSGSKVVHSAIEGMNKIAVVVEQSSEKVFLLGQNSDKIGEIIQVIEDIADQTNLLALNAAIEAARAGEQGRGFAVVADEVRKLAERTTKATKEIAEMIKLIQDITSEAVNSMKEGKREVSQGKQLVLSADKVLKDIVDNSTEVSDVVNMVAAASEEQSATAEQIGKNIESINSVIQKSSSEIQQIARSAEDLTKMTKQLKVIIEQFKLELLDYGIDEKKNISNIAV